MSKTEEIYGEPCDGTKHVAVTIPFKLIIAWDKTKTTNKIVCHKDVAKDVKNIFDEIFKEYGQEEITRLGINLYGGCYNCRDMRGGTEWSRHAYAIAIDLDPERNQLKWSNTKAQFAKPEYKKMIDIFYKYGWESLGRKRNFDWMHFQKIV